MSHPLKYNYLALFVAITHFKEVDADTAFLICRGKFKYAAASKITSGLVKEIFTKLSVEYYLLPSANYVEKKYGIDRRTIAKIYLLCKSEVANMKTKTELSQEQIIKIISMVDEGIPMKYITQMARVGEARILNLIHGNSLRKDILSGRNQDEKYHLGMKRTMAAKRYLCTFQVMNAVAFHCKTHLKGSKKIVWITRYGKVLYRDKESITVETNDKEIVTVKISHLMDGSVKIKNIEGG